MEAQMETYKIHDLPERVLDIILGLLVPDVVHNSFGPLNNFRCTSKKLFSTLNDAKILDKLQSAYKSRAQAEICMINMLRGYIKTSNMASYSAFVTLLRTRVKSRWLSRLRNEQLLNVVRFSTVKFLREYLTRDFSHSQPSPRFTNEMIIKAIDIANDRTDNNEMLIYLFPMISQCFTVADPQHIHDIMDHIKSGGKLNSKGDYLRQLYREAKHAREFNYPALSSELLLPLLDPHKSVFVVPEGKLFRQFSMHLSRKSRKQYYWKILQNMVTSANGRAIVKYFDYRAILRTIEIQEHKGIYTYEGFSTDSLYELFVRTSIFKQVFGTFPQQHVALTEENIDLDPIDQPWFFGAISATEADEILSGASVYSAVMTMSIGSEIYVCYTRPKLSNEICGPYRLRMKFRDILTRTDHSYPKFFSALYNGGHPKNMIVYHTYRTIASKSLAEIQKFIEDNRINLTDRAFSHPNILHDYANVRLTADSSVVKYLVNQGVPLEEDVIYALNNKCDLDLILWLIEKGAKMSRLTLPHVVTKHQPDLTEFKILLDAAQVRDRVSIAEEVIQDIIQHVSLNRPYKPVSIKRGILVKLAWTYGNEDNYFKILPKELIEVICSYNIDRPEWWDILEYMISDTVINNMRTESTFGSKGIFDLAPFIWQYWDNFGNNFVRTFAQRLVSNLPDIAKEISKKRTEAYVEWALKFIQRVDFEPEFNSYAAHRLLTFIAHNEVAMPLFVAMVVLKNKYPMSVFSILLRHDQPIVIDLAHASPTVTPATWIAAFMNNRPLIKYLVEQGLMHFDKPNCNIERLEDLLKTYRCDLSILDYIRQLMK